MTLDVDGLAVEVSRRAVKRMRLSVSPPDGRVRVVCPTRTPQREIAAFVRKHSAWIAKHRQRILGAAQSAPSYASGERHAVWGRPVTLNVRVGRPGARLDGDRLVLTAPADATPEQRADILHRWYGRQVLAAAARLLEHWSAVTGAHPEKLAARRMRTRWGSYSSRTDRIALSTELARYDPLCLEYVVVHELAHTRESGHGPAFQALMDAWLPDWRHRRSMLRQRP
ncbi:MAG: M48 family metallopeptidase [Propionibacteriaceae bacterium]|jgi:predicted metal-dependent hydrolase|nr:M48 family metallopeptidase [Propionibacteriaceae bacterium]